MSESNVTLVATFQSGDDERIGMRARYRGGTGKDCGYLESIQRYSDGTEQWTVIEIGGVLSVDAVSSRFKLLPGEEKKVFAPRLPEQSVELSYQQIYALLLETFELKKNQMRVQDQQIKINFFLAINRIQITLVKGTAQWSKIEQEYQQMLVHWQEKEEDRQRIAMTIAQTIFQLRG